ncbi:MAG: beta-ketoacyl-[acyl-carrier-protein] synthase family protein [Pirellulales bacterium]|nr:beta-ketoacyl-[acyl-carrier-protein] synthase family protein [Pirellulales bacterium]
MALAKEIVVTAAGVVCPIGIGPDALWAALCEGRGGVRHLDLYEAPDLPAPFGGEIIDFDPKRFVKNRKSLKVMSRDIQLAVAAAEMATEQAGHRAKPLDPDRFGVVFGADVIPCELPELVPAFHSCLVEGKFDFHRWGHAAMAEMFPLWLLKYLPNMHACHIGLAQDARGPNNTLTLGDVSSLSAVAEAARVIERGQADAMLAGGAGSRIHPTLLFRGMAHELSRRGGEPAKACRPFDADRDGMVNGEGAAALILESRERAERRGAVPLGKLLGHASAYERGTGNRAAQPLQGTAIRRVLAGALAESGVAPRAVGCVVAHGYSTHLDDEREAKAIRDVLGDVPVTAPKSFFGHFGAGSGAVEMVVGLLALKHRLIPPTLNYETPDPNCPVNVVRGQARPLASPAVLVLSHSQQGQAVAVLLGGV